MNEVSQAEWESFFNKHYWLFVNGAPSKIKCRRELRRLPISKQSKIMEVGCGTGYFLRWLKKRGYRNLYGLDYVEGLLAQLGQQGVQTIHASFFDYTVPPEERFDLVFSDGVFEHFIDPVPALKKVSALTKHLLVTIVPRPTWWNALQTSILKPPTEYNKSRKEWVAIHEQLGFSKVTSKILGLNCLFIVCQI